MLFPKLITDYRQTNDRLVIDIVNISKSVIFLHINHLRKIMTE